MSFLQFLKGLFGCLLLGLLLRQLFLEFLGG